MWSAPSRSSDASHPVQSRPPVRASPGPFRPSSHHGVAWPISDRPRGLPSTQSPYLSAVSVHEVAARRRVRPAPPTTRPHRWSNQNVRSETERRDHGSAGRGRWLAARHGSSNAVVDRSLGAAVDGHSPVIADASGEARRSPPPRPRRRWTAAGAYRCRDTCTRLVVEAAPPIGGSPPPASASTPGTRRAAHAARAESGPLSDGASPIHARVAGIVGDRE